MGRTTESLPSGTRMWTLYITMHGIILLPEHLEHAPLQFSPAAPPFARREQLPQALRLHARDVQVVRHAEVLAHVGVDTAEKELPKA